MEARFGPVWQPVGPFKAPTFIKSLPDAFLHASSRRGGLAGRVSVNPSTLLRRVKREEEEERVEQGCEQQEEASGSEIGSLLDHILEIE